MDNPAAAHSAIRPRRAAAGIAAASFLLLLAALTRLPAFGFSVIDWDESLYFLMAERWRAGHLPYTAIWDNKPVGIYAILAAFQAMFGDTIASMRLAGVAATAAAACLIGLLTLRLGGTRARGWGLLAGSLYIVGSVPDDGLASNAELFMVVFVCAGLLVLLGRGLAAPIGVVRAGMAGLCFGAACMVKYVAVFDAAAVFLVAAGLRWQARRTVAAWRAEVPVAAAFVAGGMLPFAAALGLFWWHGQAAVLVDASLASYLRRGAVPFSPSGFLQAFGQQARLLAGLYVAALWLVGCLVVAAARGRGMPRQALQTGVLLVAWIAAGVAGATVGGFYYSHYFLQGLPALCVTAGVVGVWLTARLPEPRFAIASVLAIALLLQPAGAAWATLAAMLPVLRHDDGVGLLHDTPARIAHDLQPLLTRAPAETVYVFDAQPILYSLLHVVPPTRFVLPSFLTSRFMAKVAGVDPAAELAAVMARDPVFVIRSLQPHSLSAQAIDLELYRQMDQALAGRYRVWRTYADSVVYRRDPV